MENLKNYYEILGIERDANLEEIKTAFRKKALECHPDRVPQNRKKWAHYKYIEVGTAYEVLSSSIKRREYDDFLNRITEEFEEPVCTEEDVEDMLKREMYGKPGFKEFFKEWGDFKRSCRDLIGMDLDQIFEESRRKKRRISDKRQRLQMEALTKMLKDDRKV